MLVHAKIRATAQLDSAQGHSDSICQHPLLNKPKAVTKIFLWSKVASSYCAFSPLPKHASTKKHLWPCSHFFTRYAFHSLALLRTPTTSMFKYPKNTLQSWFHSSIAFYTVDFLLSLEMFLRFSDPSGSGPPFLSVLCPLPLKLNSAFWRTAGFRSGTFSLSLLLISFFPTILLQENHWLTKHPVSYKHYWLLKPRPTQTSKCVYPADIWKNWHFQLISRNL